MLINAILVRSSIFTFSLRGDFGEGIFRYT
jgi:hypothetical protein